MDQGRQEDVAGGARLIARSGLRFDRVALGFIARLRNALSGYVPAGNTLIVTCTAPIRKDSKTAAEFGEIVARALAQKPAHLDIEKTINENVVRARLVKNKPAHAGAVVGFVHNPGVDVEKLFSS